MAITTLDGALAGMQPPVEFNKAATPTLVQGKAQSLFYLGGTPAAAVAPTPGIGGAVLTSYGGQLPFNNPSSGNTYLARLQGWATIGGTLLLCDRLWHNSGINVGVTTEQTFTGAARIPARDANGTNNGVGVFAAVEVSTAPTANTPTITLKYTNSAGGTGKTGTNIFPTTTTASIGSFFMIGLAAGDLGVQQAESITLSAAWTTSVIHAVLYRVLARLDIPTGGLNNAVDALTGGFARAYDNTVPFLVFIPATTTASNIFGHVIWTQG